MTAITLNLLAEEQIAQEAKGRDPIKIAVAIGVFAVTITFATGTVVGMLAVQSKAQATSLDARWTALGGNNEAGMDKEFQAVKTLAEDLVAVNRGHTMFAPQLALIKDVVPETILLTQLSFTVITETQPGAAPAPVEATDKASDAKPKRPVPPKNTEYVKLHIEGKLLSSRPEIEVDSFIKTLRTHPVLGSQFKTVQLRSIARPQGGLDKNTGIAPTGVFVIECEYKEQS